jgi:hypothetical protein
MKPRIKGKYVTKRHNFDLVRATKKFKGEVESVFLDFNSWIKFKTHYRLAWQKVKFQASNSALIPNARGIYIFTLQLDAPKFPAHSYIWYMGIAGHNSKNTLRKRYGNYISDQSAVEWNRPRVRYMLKKWEGHLYFNYVELKPGVDLKKIESAFLNAIIPPANLADIDATISIPRKAASL